MTTRFSLLALLLLGLSPAYAKEPITKEPAAPAYNKNIKIEPVLITSTTANGQPIVYQTSEKPEVRILLIEVPPGVETGWHIHPNSCYAYLLSGSLTLELEDGSEKTYHAGQGLAEVVNTLHNGKNLGDVPAKLVMTVLGTKDAPVAIKKEKP